MAERECCYARDLTCVEVAEIVLPLTSASEYAKLGHTKIEVLVKWQFKQSMSDNDTWEDQYQCGVNIVSLI